MPDDTRPDAEAIPVEAAPTDGRRRIGLVLAVAAAVIAVDQLTKWWAVETLSTRTIDVVWKLRFDPGAEPGHRRSASPRAAGPFISLLALVVVGGLLWYSRGVRSRWGLVALGLVAGGAVGNLVDRAFRGDAGFMQGAVVDFIDVQFWPVWNVADMAISIGAVLLVVVLAFSPGDGADGDG